MSDFEHVGTVEILIARVYSLDPQNRDITATEVVVEPGEYPLFHDGYTYIWTMDGVLNGNFMRRGDGLFIGGPSDIATNLHVTFPSRAYGPDEWKELISHPTVREGHKEQRVRITMFEPTGA